MKDFLFKQINNKIPLLLSKNDSGLIFILVLFNVGSVNEESYNAGISHFLEHVIFGPSKNYNGENIPIKYMDNNAINYNAFTSKENTGFYLESNKKNFDKMLNIIYDILVNPLFDNDEIEKERKIVFEEKANMKDSPMELAAEEYYRILFPDDSISKTIIGTDESLKNIKRKDLIQYFNKYYKNLNNITLCLSGDYDDIFINSLNNKFKNFTEDTINYEQKYLKYKIKYLKQKQKGGSYVLPLIISSYLLFNNSVINKKIDERNIEKIDYRLPYHNNIIKNKFDKTYIILNYKCDIKYEYTLDLISNLLTQGLSSILFYQLREHYNLIYTVKSYSNIYTHKGYFSIYTSTENFNSVELIIDTIINALNDLKNFQIHNLENNEYNEISDKLLDSNKLIIENNLLELQLSHSSLGTYMTRQFFLYRNRIKKNKTINKFPEELQIKNIIKNFNSVSKNDIIKVSRDTFIQENLCITTISKNNFKYKFK